MITKSTLADAKAFLCWDAFENLSIQLVPIQEAVAYFYPPGTDKKSILLFYAGNEKNMENALFLLFHEAGHARQWERLASSKKEEFSRKINLDMGDEKIDFEREAWKLGKELFIKFLKAKNLPHLDLIERFKNFAEHSLETYRG